VKAGRTGPQSHHRLGWINLPCFLSEFDRILELDVLCKQLCDRRRLGLINAECPNTTDGKLLAIFVKARGKSWQLCMQPLAWSISLSVWLVIWHTGHVHAHALGGGVLSSERAASQRRSMLTA